MLCQKGGTVGRQKVSTAGIQTDLCIPRLHTMLMSAGRKLPLFYQQPIPTQVVLIAAYRATLHNQQPIRGYTVFRAQI